MKKPHLLLSILFFLAGCGGGDTNRSGKVQQTSDGYQVESGLAQKGPLSRGSVVTVNELDRKTMAPTGRSYTYETIDNLGTFKPSSTFKSPLLETTVQGYYFNELTNERNKDWVVLRGLSDLSAGADRAVNVNVLTNLTKDRIRALASGANAIPFSAARAQAQRELLSAFYIYQSADLFTGPSDIGAIQPGNFMELDLSQSRQADQILAAISGLLVYIGQSGGGVNSFMSSVQADLADDGQLNNSTKFSLGVQQQIDNAATKTDMGAVASNLNNFYSLKTPYTRADLAQWVDSSGGVDKVIDKHKASVEGVKIGVENRSTAWAAGADDAGRCFSASAGSLYKNGIRQTGPVSVLLGDKLVMGLVASSSNQSLSAFLQRTEPIAKSSCHSSIGTRVARLQKYTVSTDRSGADLLAMPASYLGANLPGIADWSRTPVYTDLIKQARKFGPPQNPWGGPTDTTALGSDGWPVGDFGVFLKSSSGDEGTYKVSFNGQANVAHSASPNTLLANKVYDAERNLTTLDVVRAEGASQLVLVFTQTGNGIKNLKVVRPGYDALNPPLFTTSFLDHIARFKTLRFMDWLHTNNSEVSSWSGRGSLNARYAPEAGVPWEHIVALANQAGKDIWINIPVRADDDYVVQLARLLKSSLNPTSKIYVEYSNEVWNSTFRQFGINRDMATAEVNANASSTLAYDGTTDANKLAFRRVAKRSMEISNIFRGVYGDDAMMKVVRPVFASQVVQPYIARLSLDFIDTLYGAPSTYFYAFAGAPYYNLGTKQTVDGLSTGDVLQAMDASVTRLATDNFFEKNIAMTSWYKLPFLAYEGGSDTFGSGSIAAKKAASLDARMLDTCKRYMSTWYAQGGEMFMWFTAGAGNWDTQYGTWEMTPDMAITDTPKIKCMDATLATPLPALQGRNTVPGTISAWAYAGNQEPYSQDSKNTVRYLRPGFFIDYVLLAPSGGAYTFVLRAEAGQQGNLIDVAVNSKTAASAFEVKQTGWGTPGDNKPITIQMKKGFNTLRITTRTENNGFSPISLTITQGALP